MYSCMLGGETFGIKSALGVLDFRVLPSMAMSQNVGERPPQSTNRNGKPLSQELMKFRV